MLKLLRNKYPGVVVCGLLPNFVPEKVTLDEYKNARGLYIQDPWERVKSIFSKSDHGDFHPELNYALEMFQIGLVVGVCYGGIVNSYFKAETFLRENETTVFGNKKEAIKAFINHNTLTFFKGGLRWAPVFGIFCGSFSLISSCCEAYRSKPHIIDSTIAGFTVGGLFRFMFGIKGMISGAIVGGTLGSIYGTILWGLSKISKTDQTELKYAQYAFMNYRKQLLNRGKEQKGVDPLEKTHSIHVNNPLNELDSDIKQPVDSNKENKNK